MAVEEEKKAGQADLSIKAGAEKWDNVVKKLDLEERLEEIKQTDFEREREQYMEKLLGCNKDHSKEIDLYKKTYEDKIDRVKQMVLQAVEAYDSAQGLADDGGDDGETGTREELLQKASYYYQ